ncbi:MAG: SIMPL domain-containing protein [Candidatus Hydrogenedentota bacterium]
MNEITKRVVIAFVLVLFFSFPAWAGDQPELRLITVTGDAEVRIVPDEVILTLGVETWNKDLGVAKSQNDECVKKVQAVAKKYKIEPKHIQTDYISIEPRYEDHWEHRKFVGYFVRETIVFTLRDTSKFEDLLSSALEAGANYVHGVQFRTTELRKYRDQARALAIKAAQEKANDLAKELGQKVGKPHTIQEDRAGWWSWYNAWWGSRWSVGMAQNVIQNVAGGPSETESSIAVGQININARVTVSFELE